MKKWLRWLFIAPPTGVTRFTKKESETIKCNYCGSIENHKTKYIQADFVLCHHCLKKMADKILTGE